MYNFFKKANSNRYVLICGLIFISVMGFLAFSQFNESNIEGTWLLKKDPKSKWVFTSYSKAKKYYDNELQSIYTYSITSTLPDCGIDVSNPPSDHKYLVLNKINSDSKECYTIHTLNQNYLSISRFGRGGTILFERQ